MPSTSGCDGTMRYASVFAIGVAVNGIAVVGVAVELSVTRWMSPPPPCGSRIGCQYSAGMFDGTVVPVAGVM